MTTPDLASYDDAELNELRVAVAAEQERRSRVTDAPRQIAELTRAALDAGVDQSTIHDAVASAVTAHDGSPA